MFNQYRGLRKELYVLFIGRIMTNMGSMIWPMLTLILNSKLGLNAKEVAIWLLAFTFVSIPVSIIGGKLSDYFNKRNIIIICDIVSIICFLYCSLIEISFKAIVFIAIAGLFQQIEYPAYDALVADFTLPKDRERAYSLSYLGGNLGLMLSPTISGILFNDYLNIAFIISGISIALSTILISLFIKNVEREESDTDINIYEKDISNKTNIFVYIFKNRVLRTFIVTFVLYSAIYNQFNYLMPLELTSQFKEKGSIIYGTLTSVNCITVVLMTSLLTRKLRKVYESTKLIIGAILIILGNLIFKTFMPYIYFSYIAMIVFTFGEIIHNIGSRPFQTKRIPANYRGRFISVVLVFENLFVSLFRLLIGHLYDSYGSLTAWMIVLVIGSISILMCLYLKNIDSKDYPELYKRMNN